MQAALLVAAPSPEAGRGGGGGHARAPRGQPRVGLVLAARLGAAGPERAPWSRTQAEATRNERHRESDERQQRRGRKDENGETGDDKCVQATRLRRARKVKEDNTSGNGGTGGSSDDSSNGDASSAGRDKEIVGGGKEGVLTLVGVVRKWLPTLP
jgi:hypothetical protein